uniref:Uncharacterized protein n=1 Tax=Phytophthora ramorum TaxID=164328 RepID=H3GT28_PHYRM
MDLLDEFMPGMGDVLAAQEGALTSVITTLTTQLQHLAAANERQAQRMAQLESTQLSMRLAVRELQNAPAPTPVVVEVPSLEPALPDTSVLDALTTLTTKMEQLQHNVQQQVNEQMQQALVALQSSQVVDDGPARALLEETLRALDQKVSLEIGKLRSEATDSLAEKTRQTEEAVQTQLEQLEKRFDYLSRMKMEVKELMRRSDRQEQGIEDMRVGIEMLAKSLGSDDVDSETSEEGDGSAEEEEAPADEEETAKPVARKAALHFVPVFRSENSQLDVTAEARETPTEEPLPQQQDVEVVPAHPDVSEQDSATDVPATQHPLSPSGPPLRAKATVLVSKFVRRSLRRRHHATEPATPVVSSDLVDPPIPEVVVEQPIDVLDTALPEQVPESSRQQSEGERTTETVVVEQVPSSTPITPKPVAVVEDSKEEEKQEDVAASESTAKEEEQEVTREELPRQYRSQLATQQKERDDQVALFRSSSSSGSRPNVLTSVVRARRQRRSTTNRKDIDVTSREFSPGNELVSRSLPLPRPETPVVVEPRPPVTKERVKELWFILLAKLVRLQRLRQLNGINAEKALFRRQQMSMGSRVKRLEENTARLDGSLEYLERHVQDNSSAINALDESIMELQPVVDRVQKLERTQKTQARTIVDVEEKLQEIDVEIQRLRTSARRTSSVTSSVTSAVTSAISVQLQEVSSKFNHQVTAFEASEKLLTQVSEAEIPALHEKLELSLYTLRQEAEQRTTEAALELQKIVDQIKTSQRTSDGNVLLRITEFCNRIYHTLLGMSGAMLQSVELGKIEQSTKSSTRTALDVGIELLRGIFTHFIENCNTLLSQEAASEIDFLVETSLDFQQQLDKLKGQAAMAKAAAHSLALDTGGNNDAYGGGTATSNQHSSFDDHLVFMTTTKLKELEGALITREAHREGNQIPELTLFMHDVVVQVRSVLFLLLLHSEAMNSRHQVEDLRSTQTLVQSKIEEHGFALGHLDSTIALVKLMNSRLDTFMELSFAYAKEEDVKKSIEELMTSNNEMRELLTTSLENTRSETLERDGLLGEEMNQLIARVSKKLDKDELLWTQEVLERQVQNVANASLDEHDLVDIHRRLRRKLDKSQLKALLQGQPGRTDSSSNLLRGEASPTIEDAVQKSAPLVGAKCISCQGELPPTKAMIQHVVREEVHQELAKSRAQKMPPSSLATFNASNHRNLEAFKRELLLSSLQQQKHAHK